MQPQEQDQQTKATVAEDGPWKTRPWVEIKVPGCSGLSLIQTTVKDHLCL